MLRAGGFKPSGRSKPASEYLAQAAREDRFPFINNLVDINNYISLCSGLPASLLDLGVTTETMLLRFGREGEKYIFNEAGQRIDLNGLICLCRDAGAASDPLGNPVKDSMEAKLKTGTQAVVGVVFAPADFVEETQLKSFLSDFEELLRLYGQCRFTESMVV
jgi:DNA/RNA-binding domain of Phe-tRNA-synthetase-like protein